MTTLATAAIAAASIALTPNQASADGDDIAKIIAGLAVAGIFAKAIDNRKDRKEAERAAAAEASRYGRTYDGRRIIEGTIEPYRLNDVQRGPKFNRGYKQLALPDRCLRTVETARGDRLAYGARCLDRRYRHADKLPRSCETVVRTPRGFRTVYGARCLRRDGWVVARR